MHRWTKRLVLAAAPLLLTACLWGPGRFASELQVRKDGSFTLDYRGEIVLETANLPTKAGWQSAMAHCTSAGGKQRPCTPAEASEQRDAYETKRKDDEQVAKAFGLPSTDEASSRAFAAKLMKYAGWRSVAYRGNGVFDVDYHVEGRLTQDWVFPMMPDTAIVMPFVALRRRTDGAVQIDAPALSGGLNMFGPIAEQMASEGKSSPPSRANGRFTVRTDGQILTNNSEDGPSPDPLGQHVSWDISPASTKVPEILIRL